MKKVLVSAVVMLVALMPLAFANSVCDAVDSPQYAKAAGAKLVRGVGNVALSWVEFFRQPIINENKWEGVGRGIVYTGFRAVAGALDVVTFLAPRAKMPQVEPSCPTELVNVESKKA